MKKLKIFITLIFSLNCIAQTQSEINNEAYLDFKKSDEKLNQVYKTILFKYKSDYVFLKSLKKSQRLWIQFRDAEMEMKYPNYKNRRYGSIHPTCRSLYLKELTDTRIKTLNEWVCGIEEGNVCAGSVKIIEEIDPRDMEKACIEKDSSIWINANIRKAHRIFGYKNKDIFSEKMILFSIFTNEVKNNPFDCKYGAFYDTSNMKDMDLKYIATENGFLKIGLIKNGDIIDEVFMLKKWFEFEK